MEDEGVVVRQSKLHTPDDNVQALRLGPPVTLVHDVGVVNDLGDLPEDGVS